ncbi:MAG: PilZ domain-containing protein [Bryobacteraceae bacterium]|nr:PilZ domain-containing protein [Bryobacteraceae bacterium]
METREDRREETRLAVDSPAVVFWEDDEGAYHVKGRAVNLSGSGMAVRLRAPVQPGKIVWCAVPSYGIYSRALVMHARGLLCKTAGVRFLAGQILSED